MCFVFGFFFFFSGSFFFAALASSSSSSGRAKRSLRLNPLLSIARKITAFAGSVPSGGVVNMLTLCPPRRARYFMASE